MNNTEKRDKSIQQIFDLMSKHLKEYPKDNGWIYLYATEDIKGTSFIDGSLFYENDLKLVQAALLSLVDLIHHTSPKQVEIIYKQAVRIYETDFLDK